MMVQSDQARSWTSSGKPRLWHICCRRGGNEESRNVVRITASEQRTAETKTR